MKTIWKFDAPMPFDSIELTLPANAEFLLVEVRAAEPKMWFMVDRENSKEPRAFRAYGTGHPLQPSSTYLGTYFLGDFVWHVCEEK